MSLLDHSGNGAHELHGNTNADYDHDDDYHNDSGYYDDGDGGGDNSMILPRGAQLGGFHDTNDAAATERRRRQQRRKERVPPPDTPCACGTGRAYARCCMPAHTGVRPALDAASLLRSRYSAFAYRLPGYIMKSTHVSNPDYTDNRRVWAADILEFCDAYRFAGMEIIDERCAGADVVFIQFRADLLQRNAPAYFVERSRFVRERGKWYYASGKLVEAETPD